MELIPTLTTLDGRDRNGSEVDTDECQEENNDAREDDEDDYGDE